MLFNEVCIYDELELGIEKYEESTKTHEFLCEFHKYDNKINYFTAPNFVDVECCARARVYVCVFIYIYTPKYSTVIILCLKNLLSAWLTNLLT